jgi:hypothetical protein
VEYNKILREEQNEEEPQQYSRHAGRQRRISELERARRPNRPVPTMYYWPPGLKRAGLAVGYLDNPVSQT